MLLWGRVDDVCRGQVADNSSVVQVCEPISLTDPRLVWVLLAVLLLLMPDLSEIELGGVLSLKRIVQEVKADNDELRGAVAELRVTTAQIASQQQQVNIHLETATLPEAVATFQSDVVAGETGPLTTAEETGAYATLAFSSALAGFVSELFPAWEDEVTLIGWVLGENGTFEPTYLLDPQPASVVEEVAEELDPTAVAGSPVAVSFHDGGVVVTAYAVTDPTFGLGEKLVGALSVVLNDEELGNGLVGDTATPQGPPDLVTLAAGAEAAAGAYALLLLRVLGEPSTLD